MMFTPSPDLSLCLLAERPDIIRTHLRSLYSNSGSVSIETIVVARSLDTSAGELSREFPQSKIFETGVREAPARAANRGLSLAAGRYLALWDRDVLARSDCLRRMIDFMDDHPEVGIAGPRVLNKSNSPKESVEALPYKTPPIFKHGVPGRFLISPSGMHGQPFPDFHTTGEVDWLAECQFIRRETLEDVGLLDENFSSLLVHADYSRRVRRAGWHVYYVHDAEAVRGRLSASSAHYPEYGKQEQAGWLETGRYLFKNWAGWLRGV